MMMGGNFPTGQPGLPPGAMPPISGGGLPQGQVTQEEVFGLLRNNLLRKFKIDIETDSTIAGDESQEKQDRTNLIEATTKFMEAWGPMVEREPRLAPLAGQLLKFGIRVFRVGRELEEVIDETADQMASPQAMQKGDDPKVQAEKIKLQGAQLKTQAEVRKSQTDAQSGQQEAAAKLQQTIAESQARIAEARMKLAILQQQHGHKIAEAQMEHAGMMDQMALERQRAQTQAAAQAPRWPVDPSAQDQGF